MRDIIEELVKTGKEIEAVYFASEAGLTELFSPVTLLKSRLTNCRSANDCTSNNASSSEDANNELKVTRAIIKCVEDHSLESEFTRDNLRKRVAQLEKERADKKKSAAAFTSKPLTNHITSLDGTLMKKSLNLGTQIEKFKKDTEKEVNFAARVERLKDSTIRDIRKGSHLDSKDRKLSGFLRMWFRRMDSKGLMKFLVTKRKESVGLRAELAAASEEAVDLLGFVLDAVEDFIELKVSGEEVRGLADRRWACGFLIQAALPIPADGESMHSPQTGGCGVERSLKERAAWVLEKWKGVLGVGEGGGRVSAGEAAMFLQMVIGFGMKEKFEDEFLRNLVVEFASRWEMPKLAVALGFGDKMRDIIEELVKTGKEIEAVYFASESGLTELFPPVTLLKSSLRNCCKTANNSTKDVHSLEDANSEINATRAIIKCVEEHKLESQFNINYLKERVAQLEKAKAYKKKSAAASTSKPLNKRPHGGRGGAATTTASFRPPKSGRFLNTSPAIRQRNHPPPPTHQPAVAKFSEPYSYPYPSVYESNLTATSYGASYSGVHTESPVGYGLQYANPSQDIGAGGTQVVGSYGGQGNYRAYDYTAPAAPTHPDSYKL